MDNFDINVQSLYFANQIDTYEEKSVEQEHISGFALHPTPLRPTRHGWVGGYVTPEYDTY